MEHTFKSRFIAIIGRPNVGKSTFINHVIGEKVAIISDKPQTTRHKIQAVYNEEETQMIFLDTPGIHKPRHQLGEFMVQTTKETLNEVDAILFMVNAEQGYGKGDQYILDLLAEVSRPVYLAINKIDCIHPDELLPLIATYDEKGQFSEIVPISALKGENVDRLIHLLKRELPLGPKYYPDDYVTDHSEHFMISELIREKVLQFTQEEIPHSVTVDIESIENKSEHMSVIYATIVAERDSQKGIIIGKRGQMLKQIGQCARKDIESLLGMKVHLELWVKVRKNWRNNQHQLHQLGYRLDDY